LQLLAQSNADLSGVAAKIRVAGGASLSTAGPATEVKKKPLLSVESARTGANAPKPPPMPTARTAPLTAQSLPDVWAKVLGQLGPMVAGQLNNAGMPAIIGPKSLGLRFPSAYRLQYDACKAPVTIQYIENYLRTFTGEDWTIRLDYDPKAVGPAGGAVPTESNRSAQEQRQEATKIPLLHGIVERLNGTFLKLDADFGAEVALASEADDASDEDPLPESATEEP